MIVNWSLNSSWDVFAYQLFCKIFTFLLGWVPKIFSLCNVQNFSLCCPCTLLFTATCMQPFESKQKKRKKPWLNHLVIKTATEKETTAKVVGSCPWLYPVVLLIYYSWWLPFATQYSYCVLRKTHGKQKHPNPFRWKNTYNPSIKSFFSRNYPSISWTVP